MFIFKWISECKHFFSFDVVFFEQEGFFKRIPRYCSHISFSGPAAGASLPFLCMPTSVQPSATSTGRKSWTRSIGVHTRASGGETQEYSETFLLRSSAQIIFLELAFTLDWHTAPWKFFFWFKDLSFFKLFFKEILIKQYFFFVLSSAGVCGITHDYCCLFALIHSLR